MPAAEVERAAVVEEAETAPRRCLRLFLRAGATLSWVCVLAAEVEVDEETAIQLFREGFSAQLTLRLLY
jgi:hypothetical protein